MDVTLKTERLVLRPETLADVAAIATALNDYEVTRYLSVVPFPYTVEDARAWVGSLKPITPKEGTFAIDLPDHGMIGAISVGNELGYWLARSHHGRGYMTEAGEAVLDWHFASMPDDVVDCSAHHDNPASLAVQKRLGFEFTGSSSMRFVRSQGREIEHVETQLDRSRFETARLHLRGH